jgi:hypothetical protein
MSTLSDNEVRSFEAHRRALIGLAWRRTAPDGEYWLLRFASSPAICSSNAWLACSHTSDFSVAFSLTPCTMTA